MISIGVVKCDREIDKLILSVLIKKNSEINQALSSLSSPSTIQKVQQQLRVRLLSEILHPSNSTYCFKCRIRPLVVESRADESIGDAMRSEQEAWTRGEECFSTSTTTYTTSLGSRTGRHHQDLISFPTRPESVRSPWSRTLDRFWSNCRENITNKRRDWLGFLWLLGFWLRLGNIV